jgi:nicotinamidase/pyrazinamidase
VNRSRCLLLIDLQNDFLPGGALAVRDGEQAVAEANRLMPEYDVIIATQDWHPANHGSFASQHPGLQVYSQFELEGLPQVAWPDHCVQGTWGAALAPALDVSQIDVLVTKGEDPCIDSYSGFFDNGRRRATKLASVLKERSIGSIDVLGLATDYCVKFTVLDALSIGLSVRVIEAGCRGVNLGPNDCELALQAMKQAGAEIIVD